MDKVTAARQAVDQFIKALKAVKPEVKRTGLGTTVIKTKKQKWEIIETSQNAQSNYNKFR